MALAIQEGALGCWGGGDTLQSVIKISPDVAMEMLSLDLCEDYASSVSYHYFPKVA